MKQYRKKPVVIEAIQFIDDVDRILEIQEFTGQETIRVDYKDKNNHTLKIDTLEGVMTASVGDYIIKGVQGEFYPCKPDIFEKTYEEAQPKQSIIDRATDYAYMVAGGSPDIVLAGEAYQRGAEDEHRLLTEWHDVSEEPDANGLYLVAFESGNNAPKIYGVAAYFGYGRWCFEGYHPHNKPSFDKWRPIHEMDK